MRKVRLLHIKYSYKSLCNLHLLGTPYYTVSVWVRRRKLDVGHRSLLFFRKSQALLTVSVTLINIYATLSTISFINSFRQGKHPASYNRDMLVNAYNLPYKMANISDFNVIWHQHCNVETKL